MTVDWGDGSPTESPSNFAANLSHTYAEAGDYTVRISCADGETWSPGMVSGNRKYGIIGQYSGKLNSYPTLTAARLGAGARMSVGYSFVQCTGLSSIVMTEDITTIRDYAFYQCSGLTSVDIPESVTIIGDCAFYGCSGLTSVTIPDNVMSIGSNAFYGCTNLISTMIGNGVTSIHAEAFSNCNELTNVTIGNSVMNIGSNAFTGCNGLTEV